MPSSRQNDKMNTSGWLAIIGGLMEVCFVPLLLRMGGNPPQWLIPATAISSLVCVATGFALVLAYRKKS